MTALSLVLIAIGILAIVTGVRGSHMAVASVLGIGGK